MWVFPVGGPFATVALCSLRGGQRQPYTVARYAVAMSSSSVAMPGGGDCERERASGGGRRHAAAGQAVVTRCMERRH